MFLSDLSLASQAIKFHLFETWILTDAGGAVAAGSSKDTLMKVKTESVRDGWVHKAIFSLILSTTLFDATQDYGLGCGE